MSKRNSGHGVLSGRALRRYNERVEAIEQREAERIAQARAWINMTPEERRQHVAAQEYVRKVEKNGITIDDVIKAEDEAYQRGINDGKSGTFRQIFAAICLTLHELHGFDDEQCTEVLNDVYQRAAFALTTQELVQEAYDAVGIELSFDGEGIEEPVSVKE